MLNWWYYSYNGVKSEVLGVTTVGEIISLKNITWRRGKKEILKDVSWTVNCGEQWAILGLNGAGKTSILDIVLGYNYPTSGKATVIGTEFGKASLPEMRKKIGYVSSSLDKFHQTLNRETAINIVISGKFASFGIYEDLDPETIDLADSILHMLNLSHLRDRTYDTFSQGERRRILIGRALMGGPELLILDEPCSGLDVRAREDVLNIVKRISDEDRHLLYVTHHIEELIQPITHVLLIKDGEVLKAGPKKEVLTDYNLSEVYKTPVAVRFDNDRPSLIIKETEAKDEK